MKYASVSRMFSLVDPAKDRAGAEKIGQYRVGPEAIWLPAFPVDKYIPFGAIRQVISRASELHPTGCCGGGIPVTRILVRFDEGNGVNQEAMFVIEDSKKAQRFLEKLSHAIPGIVAE